MYDNKKSTTIITRNRVCAQFIDLFILWVLWMMVMKSTWMDGVWTSRLWAICPQTSHKKLRVKFQVEQKNFVMNLFIFYYDFLTNFLHII